MKPILLRTPTQLPEQICKAFLFINREVILRSPEEDHAPLADDDREVSNLLLRVFGE